MAKLIKITQEYLEKLQSEIVEALKKAKLSDGKFTFTKSMDKIDEKAELWFSEIAWVKMQMLIHSIDKEVAWHGVARRDDDDANVFIVEDILVYPQEITGTTVESDDEAYPKWYMELEDYQFNNLRMQGHSHVNMGTTPSATDNQFYDKILQDVPENSFYIFCIFNKKGEHTCKIYDLANNLLYENADITVGVIDEGNGIDQFLKDAKEMVKTKTYTQPAKGAKSYTATGPSYKPVSYYGGGPTYTDYGNNGSKKSGYTTKYTAGFSYMYDDDDF